jgi:hypothetical protein
VLAKGWSDVCYEFFIVAIGDVWEGRAGALTGPVVADATGGSQGFAQLICCSATSQPAADAGSDDVARQGPGVAADRYDIDIVPARHDIVRLARLAALAGRTPVTTATIAGHRDMSFTECPGDALYPLLPEIRAAASPSEAWRRS